MKSIIGFTKTVCFFIKSVTNCTKTLHNFTKSVIDLLKTAHGYQNVNPTLLCNSNTFLLTLADGFASPRYLKQKRLPYLYESLFRFILIFILPYQSNGTVLLIGFAV